MIGSLVGGGRTRLNHLVSRGSNKLGLLSQGSKRFFGQVLKGKGAGLYSAHREKLFRLQNGYYIIYYNKPKWWYVPRMFLSRAIAAMICLYMIKVNPFYRTYPIMLPLSFIALVAVFMSTLYFSKKTNTMIQ